MHLRIAVADDIGGAGECVAKASTAVPRSSVSSFKGGEQVLHLLLDEATNEHELYEQIGRLKMEVEWLKKKSAEVG